MSERLLSNKYSWFINSLLFIFPIVINSQKVAGDLILLILAITGLFITFFYKTSPFSVKELKTFNWLVLGYFAVICISILFSGKALELAHFISRELYFLFAPFIALAIFKAEVKLSVVLYGIKLGLIVLAALVYFNAGGFNVRYSGVMNANSYGVIAVVLTFFSITNISKENLINQLITLISFLSGILVVVSSATRAAWIALIISIFLYIWIAYIRKELKHFLKLSLVFILLTLSFSSFINNNLIESRVLQAEKNIVSWFSGEDTTSSVSVRLEMWKLSIDELIDNPSLTGIGYRNNITTAISKNADKAFQRQVRRYTHVHNVYLNHFLAGGLFGLISVILLLLLPFKRFIISIKRAKKIDNIAFAAMGAGAMLIFFLYGFTNKVFGDIFMNSFYVLYISLLLPIYHKGAIKNPFP